MPKKEDLEVEFNMYLGAIKDLESNEGDEEAIKTLRIKASRKGQALNMIRDARENRGGLFSDIGRKSK
jgi:hypothetical protein